VAVLALTQTVGYGALAMGFPVLLLPMCRSLHATVAAVTLASTISTLTGALAAVPIGRWLDRHGARLAMAGGSVLGLAAVAGWSQARSVGELYVSFFFIGIALAASTYEVAFAVVVLATEAGRRDQALLWLTIATAGTSAFFYPLTGWLNGLLGWRGAVLALASLLVVFAIPGHLWVVPDRRTHLARARRRTGLPVGAALGDVGFWLIALAFVLEAAAGSAISVQLVAYLEENGHSAQTAATLPMIIGLLSIPIRLVMRPLIRRFGLAGVTGAAFVVQAAGATTLYLVARSLPIVCAAIAASGFGVAVGTLTRPAILADRYGPARYAGIVSVTALFLGLARGFAPFGAAFLAHGSFLLWAAAACLLGAASLSFVRPPLPSIATRSDP
jgi:MFS family permease